jgi:hypothetical protein
MGGVSGVRPATAGGFACCGPVVSEDLRRTGSLTGSARVCTIRLARVVVHVNHSGPRRYRLGYLVLSAEGSPAPTPDSRPRNDPCRREWASGAVSVGGV